MAARRFSAAAGAAGLWMVLIAGAISMSSAVAREPWPGDADDTTRARPHPNCEGLSGNEMMECERRMRDRMRNSSDDARTRQGTEQMRREEPSGDRSSSKMQTDDPPVESSDRKRLSRSDTQDSARKPQAQERTRPSQERPAGQESSQSSDTLGREATREPDYSDNSSPQSTSQTDTSATSRDKDTEADTLGRDRNDDNSATDTTSPK